MVKQRSLTEDELLKLEKMELSDDEDDFQYTNVEVLDDDDDDDEVDFQAVLRNLNKEKENNTATEKAPSPVSKGLNNSSSIPPRAVSTQVRPSVVDDFIRNFLIKISMPRTLDTFNTEWYELMAKGKLKEEDIGVVPDIYLRNQALDDQVKALRKQLDETKKITEKAKGTWDKFRHQRDVHKMHHQRVVQEKNSLLDKIKKLRKNIAAYEPLLAELRTKYEVAMKEKMLMRLERDRYMAKTEALEAQVRALEQKESKSSVAKSTASPTKSSIGKKSKKGDTKLPTDNAPNPHADKQYEVVQIKRVEQIKVFQGHLNSIAAVAFHPKNPVLATVSDDETWKLWSLPNCELIMSGEGHRDWIAGIEFHPRGTHIATSSGDNTIKLWDFVSASCMLTLHDHAHPVWESAFHHEGDFLASSSMDHTCKLWDLHTGKCRKTFRGHVDSVNSVCFQPYTVNICTGSGDKTVSIWDIRSGLCVQTFYGHQNTCNSVAFSLTGDTIASCDADGFIKLWDVRMVAERATIDGGQQPLNSVAFDKSGQVVAAASDDGTIKMCNAKTYEYISDLRGHEGPVQSVKFDPVGRYIASASSDCTFRLWA